MPGPKSLGLQSQGRWVLYVADGSVELLVICKSMAHQAFSFIRHLREIERTYRTAVRFDGGLRSLRRRFVAQRPTAVDRTKPKAARKKLTAQGAEEVE